MEINLTIILNIIAVMIEGGKSRLCEGCRWSSHEGKSSERWKEVKWGDKWNIQQNGPPKYPGYIIIVKQWQRLPREVVVVGVRSLELKAILGSALRTWSSWRWPCLLQECWTKWILKIPFNLHYSTILWFNL